MVPLFTCGATRYNDVSFFVYIYRAIVWVVVCMELAIYIHHVTMSHPGIPFIKYIYMFMK